MNKTSLGPQTFIPMVQSILGCMVDGKPNYMALGWQTRVNHQPPMLGIGVHSSHASWRGIRESKAFSVNFPSQAMMEANDLVGILSADKWDKSGLFEAFYGELPTAPMIAECVFCLECELVRTVDLPTNTFFIGDIKGAYADEAVLDGDNPDLAKMEAMFLTMPDNRYWSVGQEIGKAWKAGMNIKQQLVDEGKLKEKA